MRTVIRVAAGLSQIAGVLAALLLDQHLKGHELKSLMISHPYHAYGNPRECIQMRCSYLYCTSCNPG